MERISTPVSRRHIVVVQSPLLYRVVRRNGEANRRGKISKESYHLVTPQSPGDDYRYVFYLFTTLFQMGDLSSLMASPQRPSQEMHHGNSGIF